jgi:hypothetical protein
MRKMNCSERVIIMMTSIRMEGARIKCNPENLITTLIRQVLKLEIIIFNMGEDKN